MLCKQYWPIFEFRRNSIGQSATRSDVIHAASSALSSKKIEIDITNNCGLLLNSDIYDLFAESEVLIRFVVEIRSIEKLFVAASCLLDKICINLPVETFYFGDTLYFSVSLSNFTMQACEILKI